MKNKQKFNKFLESLKDGKHNSLIESVKQGFRACCESVELVDVNGGEGFHIEVSIDNDLLNKLPKVAEKVSICINDMKENREGYYTEYFQGEGDLIGGEEYNSRLSQSGEENLINHLGLTIDGDCKLIGDWHGGFSSARSDEEASGPEWEGDAKYSNLIMQITLGGITEFPDSIGVVTVEDGSPEKIWMDDILDTYIREPLEIEMQDGPSAPSAPKGFSTSYNGPV